MNINNTYAVLGLGRYGYSVAKELVNAGAEVIAIDNDETRVNYAASEIPFCKCADITDIEVLRRLGIANLDTVIVAVGGDLESSVMSVMLCKELGVKTVIAKSSDEMHSKILTKIGADKIVFPEKDSGIRLAKNLLSSSFFDIVELSEDISLKELSVKKEWIGKSLLELNLRKKHAFNIVAIKENDNINIEIDPNLPLNSNMKLIVIGNTLKLSKLK